MSDDIKRDRWGRPLIVPLNTHGHPDMLAKPIAYTRVSTMAKSLDDTSNLTLWKQRVTALGLMQGEHLRTRLAAVMASYDDALNDKAGKRKLNEIVAEAFELGGGSKAASVGTGLHELTEALDLGRDITAHAGEWGPRIVGYASVMSNYEILDIETFIVNDTVLAAGSFDRLLRCPDGRVRVADLKTGAHDSGYPLGVATQIATYANGDRYNHATGERTPLHEDLDTTTGLLIHMPAKGEGITVYPLDLTRGWHAAQIASHVHQIRKWKPQEIRGAALFSA